MPPPPGSRLGADVRIFRVGSTRAVLTKMSTAGLMVIVTMSLTIRKRYSRCRGSDSFGTQKKPATVSGRLEFYAIAVSCRRWS
jgi:hypothetical protein